MNSNCYCGKPLSFEDCCKPLIEGKKKSSSAEDLMRSRYSAFAIGAAEYLVKTTHVSTRKFHKKEDILNWAKSNQWVRLEILESTETTVTFKAYYLDERLKAQVHYEKSTFIFENGSWFYIDGEFS